MSLRAPAFVDCYGDLAQAFTEDMRALAPGLEVIYGEAVAADKLVSRLVGRRHAMVYMGFLSEAVLSACPDLRTVAYLSTGLATHADLDAAQRLGVQIEGVKGYGDRAVAEHSLMLMLASLKRLVESDRKVRAGQWGLLSTEEIGGKTVGIVGLGGIGRETARLAAALGATVLGWNRSAVNQALVGEQVHLDDLLHRSDIVSLSLALNEQTTHFIDGDKFTRMKRGAVLVNTARGALVEETALVDALKTGQIGHAALDVFHDEPLPPDSPLLAFENVTLTPHTAWYTHAAIERLLVAGLELMKRQIARFENP